MAWRAIHALPPHQRVIQTANGALAVENKDWLIGKKLYVDRGYEVGEMDSAVAALRAAGWLPPERTTMVDAGANIGMIAIAMLLRGHFQRALAFEPVERSHRLLVDNVARNGLTERVHCLRLALSAGAGEADMGICEDNSGDSRIEREGAGAGWFREERRSRARVPTVGLDAWLESAAVDPGGVGLVWLDVQGHEVAALRGALSLLRHAPAAIEVWPYALDRSGAGTAGLLALAREAFGAFLAPPLSGPPRATGRLADFLAALGSALRAMTQIILLPRS